MIRKPFSHKSLQRTAAKSSQSDHSRQRSLHPIPALEVAHLQRAIGNRATARLIQRASIHPGEFFDGAQAGDEIQAGIQGNVLRGFGLDVNGRTWHTKLVFDPEHTPGAVGEEQMYPEGSGVRGVIGPDHPLGSEPNLVPRRKTIELPVFFNIILLKTIAM